MQDEIMASQDQGTEQERTILVVAYVLHGLAIFNGLTAIAGVIVNHLKVNETNNPFIQSHHRWLIRTFWWGLLWSVICTVLMLVLIGWLGFLVLAVWWVYRIVRGVLNYTERQLMPVD